MPKVTKDGKTYHFPYTAKGMGEAKNLKKTIKRSKKKTMFSKGRND